MGNFTATTILKNLGLEAKNAGTSIGNKWHNSNEWIASYSPIDSAHLGDVSVTTEDQYNTAVSTAHAASKDWRNVPAPQRGE